MNHSATLTEERRFALPLTAMLTAFACLGASFGAHAQLPTGPTLIHGTAVVGTVGNQMTVTNSPNAILNWQSFSIGASHGVRFQQESAASKVLNRVTGNDPSQIFGGLTSNGQVWLINPHGVLFGQNARIDVAGLVASTLDISNADFLGNRFNFATAGATGRSEVLNHGEIRTSFGGRVWLIGEQVRNENLIESPGGNIVLAAGKSIELVDSGMPNVIVRVTAPENETVNLGTLVAAGGSVDLHGGIVNQNGIVRADSVGTDAAGRITLRAQGDVTLGDSSQTSASAAGTGAGGSVLAQSSSGTTQISGQVSATSAEGQGGKVHLLGENVEVIRHASVDASGASGGGEVLVGGDYRGKNSDIANATTTYFGSAATLKANATKTGDGGRVIAWGNDSTKAFGTIEAKGGPLGGNGGLIETSGKSLDFAGARVSASAAHGLPGQWLLDPTDITIDSTGAVGISSTLTGGTDVTVDTSGGSEDFGDLTVAGGALIDHSGTADVKLTLAAHRDILIESGARIIATGAGSLALDLNAGLTPVTGSGRIAIDTATITTKGGAVRMYGQSDPINGVARARREQFCLATGCFDLPVPGVTIAGTSIDTGDGNISIRGDSSYAEGVSISSSTIESAGGTISLNGHSSSNGGPAVSIIESSTISSLAGNVNIVGDATSATNADVKPHGIEIADTNISGGAGVDLRGDSILDDGVRLSNSTMDSNVGRVKITGTSRNAYGAYILGGTTITAYVGVNIQGQSQFDDGIIISESTINSPAGRIEFNGTGASSEGAGVFLSSANLVADMIAIDGYAPSTASLMMGVYLTGNSRLTGRDIRVTGRTESASSFPFGKYWSTFIENSTIEAGTGGNILIQGLDGYLGIAGSSSIVASGNTPITIEAVLPDIFQGTVGGVSAASYSGNITFRGEWVIFDKDAGGPNIVTSGQVLFAPPNRADPLTVADLIVGLEAASFDPGITKILFGGSSTRDIYFHNSNGLRAAAGPISVDSPVFFSASRNTYFSRPPVFRGRLISGSYSNSGLISTAPGDAITVVTGVFDNGADPSAALSTPNGRWLIYATDPATSNEGFTSYNKHYDQTFTAGSAPAYATTGNWFFYSIAPTLETAPGPQTTIYGDATSFTASFTGFIDGDSVATAGISGTPIWTIDGPISSSGKPIVGIHGVAYRSDLSSSLGYRFADATSSTTELTVIQKSLTPTLTGDVSKVYNRSTAAPVTAGNISLAGVVTDDVVGGSLGSADYDNWNVGSGKRVTATGIGLTGVDSGNYVLASTDANANVGTIIPATLTYVADPAARLVGGPVTGLTGSLSGFVPGDTASDSTTGALVWVTPATSASPAGPYAVNGDGLAATNYRFVQDPRNATALTLLLTTLPIQPPTNDEIVPKLPEFDPNAIIGPAPPGAGNVIDATPATIALFGPLDLSLMNRDEMQQVLDSRHEFKKKLFADAIFKLEEDPSLADVRPCASAAEASSGMCILTDEQRAMLGQTASTRHLQRTKIAKLPQIERKIAVLFGLNQYADTTIPGLVNAISDAEAVGKLLAETQGYELRVVRNATKADVVRTLNQLATEVSTRDSVIIYYAGHGFQLDENGAGYWLPTDASATDPRGWLSNKDVSKMLSGINVSQLALISDSCYSGAFAREQQMAIDIKTLIPAEVLNRRAVVVMASGGDEPVADSGKGGHSIFAWYLMQNVRQVDNWRPGTTIFEQVRRDVHKSFPQTPQYGAASSAGHQGGDYLFEFRQMEDVR